MKQSVKKAAVFFFTCLSLPLYGCYWLSSFLIGRDMAFYDISQFLSLFPGISGNYLRYGFYKLALNQLGKDACICFGTTLSHPEIEIGNGVYVGPHCNLGLCSIEDDSLIGTGVHILSGLEQHGIDEPGVPIREQERKFLKVIIGKDCWIGNRAVVAANVGEKSVIGTNSTVVKDIPAWSIAAGNPARVVKKRNGFPAED